jgi:hypothetical protein
MDYTFLRKVANYFKKSNLAPYPLSIKRVKLKDDGQCEFKNKKFFIRINRELPENHSIDVLIHEVAHALSWNKDEDIHGPSWGKAYSKVYRIFLENFIQ